MTRSYFFSWLSLSLISLVFLVFVLWICLPVAANALTLSPLRQTYTLDPGQKEITAIFLTNETSDSVLVVAEVDAFTIDEQTQQAVFGGEDLAVDWITPDRAETRLLPGETKEILFRITVPEDASPGAHYLGLFGRQAALEGQVGVSSRLGSLLFLYVSGEMKEALFRQNFQPDRGVFLSPPVSATLTLTNNGTIHVIPTGRIFLKNSRQEVIASEEINSDQKKIFPNGQWEKSFSFQNLSWQDSGRLSMEVDMIYGLRQQSIHDRIEVWYIAKEVVAAGFLALLVFFLAVWFFLRRSEKSSR